MNRGFSIKNMNEGLDIMPDMPDQNYRMERTLQIMNRMNESASDSTNAVTCPICGSKLKSKGQFTRHPNNQIFQDG